MTEAAFTYIAESVVKAIGTAGVEAMAMHKAMTMVWKPIATEFADELLAAVITSDGHVRPERAEFIMAKHKIKLSHDFIEEVAPYIEEYAGYAYDRGKESILSNAISGVLEIGKTEIVAKQTDAAIIEQLVTLTGSTKENVQRTIKRWFKTTQGQYFDRYIVPETARLMTYAEGVEGNVTTLRSIGQNYKKFVEADAYWDAVSQFNAESSKVWAQVQTLHEIGVDTYTVVAIIDNKTCPVCIHMNGTTWDVQQAVNKIYDMLIMESEEAYEQNPFPPRSTPKDYPDPQEAPYELPPYHPRCRCDIRSTHAISMMPQDVIARPFNTEKPPNNKLLSGVFNTYVEKATANDIKLASGRVMTGSEYKIAKQAYDEIPYELRKWASRNKTHYKMYAVEGDKITCRVIGNRIEINSKFFDPKRYGPEVIQHELRHALINREVITARGGAEALWETLQDSEFKMPIHVNHMWQYNGGRGFVAARSAVDEFLALIGDYYHEGMSFDKLVQIVKDKNVGIEIAKKVGQITSKGATLWTAREAKKAVELWWYLMDIDNLTLLTNKQVLAKISHLPMSAAKMHIATTNELRLRDILRAGGIKKAFQEGDRKPFDIWIGADPAAYYSGASKAKPVHMIEVKSIIEAKNDKITMHKPSLARKKAEWKKFGVRRSTAHTVVFDERTGKIYYKEGLGSFRLGSMQEVSEADLQVLFGGRAQVSHLAPTGMPETVTYREITTAKAYKEFRKNMELVKPEHRLFLDWYSWQEYKAKGIRIFMDKDGYTGFGLTKDNTLVTLWTRADAPAGIGKRSILEAIRRGCDNLECFDGKLPTIYKQFGFREVARYGWNPEYAPEGWLVDKFGTPDYLEMRLTSAEARAAAPSRILTPPTYTNYEKAALQADKWMRANEYEEVFHDYITSPQGIAWDWNQLLRGSATLNDAIDDFEEGLGIRVLHEALEDAPSYSGKTYRGMRFRTKLEFDKFYDTIEDAINKDDPLLWKGFTSTSHNKITATEFASRNDLPFQIMVEIEGKSGTALKNMLAEFAFEDEVLYDAFTSFAVKSFTRVSRYEGLTGQEIWVLKLKEVPKSSSGIVEAAKSTEVMAARNSYKYNKLRDVTPLDESEGKGINASYVAKYEGKKVLYKPIEGETWKAADMHPDWSTEHFMDYFGVGPDQPVRFTIDNMSLSLAERELMAREVFNDMDFDFIKMPKVHPVYDGDKLVGAAIEWLPNAAEDLYYQGRSMLLEEDLETFVFDYMIGNTDRHRRNWMRMERLTAVEGEGAYKKGTAVMIDHGYTFAAGMNEFRSDVMERLYLGFEWDIDTDLYEKLIDKVKSFDIKAFVKRHPNMNEYEAIALNQRKEELLLLLKRRKVGDWIQKTRSWGYHDLESAAFSFFAEEEMDYREIMADFEKEMGWSI